MTLTRRLARTTIELLNSPLTNQELMPSCGAGTIERAALRSNYQIGVRAPHVEEKRAESPRQLRPGPARLV